MYILDISGGRLNKDEGRSLVFRRLTSDLSVSKLRFSIPIHNETMETNTETNNRQKTQVAFFSSSLYYNCE